MNTKYIGETTASFVYQNMLNGGGLAAMNNTRSALGAKPLANSTYQRYKRYIEMIAKQKYKESMKEVDEAIFRHYESIGVVPDENGSLPIEVIYDGTWMKRGHQSPIGIGVVTEAYTGFVIDAEVFSKNCNACSALNNKLKTNKLTKEQYDAAYEDHKNSGDCKKNFDQASGNMEAAGALALWQRSRDRKFIYKVFVGDGD